MRLRIRGSGARTGRRTAALAGLLALALAAPLSATTSDATAESARTAAASADDVRQYEVHLHSTAKDRTALQRTGVTVDEVHGHGVVVSGRADQIKRLRTLGYEVTRLGAVPDRSAGEDDVRLFDFPSGDSKYHNYA